QQESLMLTQELDKMWSKEKQILLKLDEDPDFLQKTAVAFESGMSDYAFSKPTPQKLQEELEKLVNEYYEL
ncbi:25212_t:CDS:1, partial [Gigaspora rosea]